MVLLLVFFCKAGRAQGAETEQLLLNWEKLTQLKSMLHNLYEGYRILHKGYTTLKDLSEGNFSLHKGFLDGLLEVSPGVRKYKRIAGILELQLRMVKELKQATAGLTEQGRLLPEEGNYLKRVYAGLFQRSLQNLNELGMVVTAGTLRMSDDERLAVIDRVYDSLVDQYSFFRDFNNAAWVLSLQRQNELRELNGLKKIHGMK